ncbi:hypothetical protein [Streptomyces sp. GC420]|uniref:hypothetical protein n=1 Tax=Streptomyces sp. GC420 TaxID=2697568 RepID=UPI001AA1CA70|nr:hypothetical protein [Streptomyces sp. GC420]NBM16386.1 hypothetical protein [Streptomyces sp. GC420]
MSGKGPVEPEEYFRTLLLALGELRGLVEVSWRQLAAQIGVPHTTLESWLRHGKVPDEVDAVKRAAGLLLAAARQHSGASTAAHVARLDQVDWSSAHAAVQSVRGEARSRSARTGRARRAQPHPAGAAVVQGPVVHRAVSSWSARQLRVHAAVPGEGCAGEQEEFALPAYVPREHDVLVRNRLRRLAESGEAALLVLRGGSCTGKTRTAYEAVREVVPAWPLVYPKTAEALVELLAGSPVAARTVVWLDDLHRLLAEPEGEQAAALLRELLEQPGPVAAVATIWPQNYRALVATPYDGQADRHGQARALLSSGWTVDVPESFTGQAWQEFVRRAASDPSLAAVAAANRGGAVTQTLAAGPELLEHWQQAPHAYGKAVLTAAIDARRLGVRAPLPEAFLKQAVTGYLTPRERAEAEPSWFEQALAYARQPIKQVTSALLPVAHPTQMGPLPGVVDVVDYLEQHAGARRWDQVPPATFWDAAYQHLGSGEDLERLALHAFSRSRYRTSRELYLRAGMRGSPDAVEGMCFSYTETGRILTLPGRDEVAALAREANDGGYSLWYVGSTLASIGTEERDQQMCVLAADLLADSYTAGYRDAAFSLAELWESTGLPEEAAQLTEHARQAEVEPAAASGADLVLVQRIREVLEHSAGPHEHGPAKIAAAPGEIRQLARRLARKPSLLPLRWQTRLPDHGYADLTEQLLSALIDSGSQIAVFDLERFLARQGRDEAAASVLTTAAEEGNDRAVAELVSRWCTSRPEEAGKLLEHCRRSGRAQAVVSAVRPLLTRPQPAVRRLAEEHLGQLAQDGSSGAQMVLAVWRLDQWQQSGPVAGSAVPQEILRLLEKASAHQTEARRLLGQHALIAGNATKAEFFYRGAIDGGDYSVLTDLARLLHPDSPDGEAQLVRCGLEADGSARTPW